MSYNVQRYTIKNERNKPVKGSFTLQELQPVKIDANTKYKVEKILGQKRINGVPHIKVRWLGYEPEFDSYVTRADLMKWTR